MKLFGFLATERNAVVAPIHPKAMPVILTTPEDVDLWLLPTRRKHSNCNDHCPTMRCELSRAVKRKMARVRTPRLAGIKTQCSCFDALRRFQPYRGAICSHKLRHSRAGSLILYRSERPLSDRFPALTSRMMSSPMAGVGRERHHLHSFTLPEVVNHERFDSALALRRWARREQIGDLLGGQAGARHPALASSRSIRPFA